MPKLSVTELIQLRSFSDTNLLNASSFFISVRDEEILISKEMSPLYFGLDAGLKRKFIFAFRENFLRKITKITKINLGQSARIAWTLAMAAAFQTAKDSLCPAVSLVHPSPGAEISLMVDTSNEHVGAALQQRTSPSAPWQPLGFFL
jgi:hypothetical protein